MNLPNASRRECRRRPTFTSHSLCISAMDGPPLPSNRLAPPSKTTPSYLASTLLRIEILEPLGDRLELARLQALTGPIGTPSLWLFDAEVG